MDQEERQFLESLREGFAGQNRALVMLVKAHERTAAVQTETLCKILELVTEIKDDLDQPMPKSEIPDILATIIAMLRDQDVILHRLDKAAKAAAV